MIDRMKSNPVLREVGHSCVGHWARRCGVPGLVLGLAAVTSASKAMAVPRTIILNTGFDQANNLLLRPGALPPPQPCDRDNEWRIVGGLGPAFEEPSFVVDDTSWENPSGNPNASGGLTYFQSGWISYRCDRSPGAQTMFEYTFYFTLPAEFSSPVLTMKLNADNVIEHVTLNSNIFLNTPPLGNFNAPPLSITFSSPGDFLSGVQVNKLVVRVRNTADTITGLIVEGKVEYEDCERGPIQGQQDLSSITFYESTVLHGGDPPIPHTFLKTSSELKNRLNDPLGPGNNDFEGASGEVYDVFYSNWDGVYSASGQFITIEAVWCAGAPVGGGLNIAEVRYNSIIATPYANSVVSFVALGNNAILSGPGGVGTAVDGLLTTDTTMGNTCFSAPPPLPSPAEQRLRLTIGFPCGTDVPALSQWGLAVLTLLLLIAGKLYFARRERAM